MIKCVLFDFAGVAVNKPFFEWGTGKAGPNEALSLQLRDLADRGMDTGRLNLTEYLTEVGELVGLAPCQVHKELVAAVRPNKQVVSIALDVQRRGRKTALLSNINGLLLSDMLLSHGIRGCFHEVYASSQYKLVKPNPVLYTMILDELGYQAEEVAYFDDTESHVAVATQLGMQARNFVSPEQMWEDLHTLGVF